jgi:hypothetical protein
MSRGAHVALWIVQVLLAALFLFAGGFKLVASPDQMTGPINLPVWFLRFIGACEVTGALGLQLPGLFRVRTDLTPLAASGLVVIMIGATVLNAIGFGAAMAIPTAVIGSLAAWVAYARWRTVPLGARVTT